MSDLSGGASSGNVTAPPSITPPPSIAPDWHVAPIEGTPEASVYPESIAPPSIGFSTPTYTPPPTPPPTISLAELMGAGLPQRGGSQDVMQQLGDLEVASPYAAPRPGLARGAFYSDADYQHYVQTGDWRYARPDVLAMAPPSHDIAGMQGIDVAGRVLGDNPFGKVIFDIPLRALGAGQSAFDIITVHADALIPGPGQGTLKDRFDKYVREGAPPDIAANKTMHDYGDALAQFAETPSPSGDLLNVGARAVAQGARVTGLVQSLVSPAPVPGSTSIPFVAGLLKKGGGEALEMAAKALAQELRASGTSEIRIAEQLVERLALTSEDAAKIARTFSDLGTAGQLAANKELAAEVTRRAAQVAARAAGRIERIVPPEDLGPVGFGEFTKAQQKSGAERIIELQRDTEATGGRILEEAPPVTEGAGGNVPTRGFQIEKFPESVQPLMRDLAAHMDPALADATRPISHEDLQTAAQLIGRPVAEVARDLPKRGVTSAQIQMVRQGVAMKVQAAVEVAAKATRGEATHAQMWDAITHLQEAAAIQASLHEASSEAGRALNALKTQIAPELAANPTALAYMAAISRVARSPEHANTIFQALQDIGNDPDKIYALLRTLNKPTLGENLLSIWNMPRALKASMDFSAGGRQALISLSAHPEDVPGFYRTMWSAFRDEAFADSMDRLLRTGSAVPGVSLPLATELAKMRQAAGIYLAETGPLARISQREEAMMTNLLGKLQIKGIGYNASERAYVTPLNWLRATRFDNTVIAWKNAGINVTPQRAKYLAEWINISTGRGELPNWAAQAVPFLNTVFFAPRFAVSRFEALGYAPYMLAKAAVKKAKGAESVADELALSRLAAQDLVKFVSENVALLGLAKIAGADVEIDPQSPEFGKIKVGNTLIDTGAGEQQVIRNITQLITGHKKTVTGANRGDIVPVARNETIGRFIESKLSPTTGLLWDISKGGTAQGLKDAQGQPMWDQPVGRDFLGQDFTLADLAASTSSSLFLPMSWGDVIDAIAADRAEGGSGIRGALLGATSLAGFGVTTYGSDESPARGVKVPRPAGVRTGGYHVPP